MYNCKTITIGRYTKCTFSPLLPFYVTELDFDVDGHQPHNFVLINGIPLEHHIGTELEKGQIFRSMIPNCNTFF